MWQQLQFENALRQVFGIEFTPVMIERRGRMPPALRARSKLISSYNNLKKRMLSALPYMSCAQFTYEVSIRAQSLDSALSKDTLFY